MSICLDSPLPSINTIMAAIKPNLTFPPKFPKFPNFPVLPSMPYPLYHGMHKPSMEGIDLANSLHMAQLHVTMMGMIKPMVAFLGIGIDAFLPKIPGTSLNLKSLIAPGSGTALYNAVKAAIGRGFQFPGVPSIMFPTLKMPDVQIFHTIQLLIANYMQTVATAIVGLVGSVTKKLKIGGMSAPSFPSASSVISMVQGQMAAARAKVSVPSSANLKLPSMVGKLSFPGFPAMPVLPSPLIPSFSVPEIELIQLMTALMNNLTLGVLIPVMNFIKSTLKRFLSFSFPLICLPL